MGLHYTATEVHTNSFNNVDLGQTMKNLLFAGLIVFWIILVVVPHIREKKLLKDITKHKDFNNNTKI